MAGGNGVKVPEPVVDFRLTLMSDGRMEVNVPRDLTMCLRMISQFLATVSEHATFKDTDSRIVVPKIVMGKHHAL